MARTPDLSRALETTVVRAIRSEVGTDLRRLKRQITKLSDDLKKLTPATRRSGNGAAGKPRGPVSKGRQLHGRYIGLLRHLPKKAHAKVRSVRKRKGVEAAIKAAHRLKK